MLSIDLLSSYIREEAGGGLGLEDLVTDLAVEAVVRLAVVLIEVEQRLCVGGGTYLLPDLLPPANDTVVFRRYLLHERVGVFRLPVAMVPQGKGILIRQYSIDNQYINRTLAQQRRVGERESSGAGGDVAGIHQRGEKELGLMEQLCKLAETHFGERLRTHAGIFPHGGINGDKGELLLQETVLAEEKAVFVGLQTVFGEQSRLPEEDSGELKKAVAVLLQAGQWRLDGDTLEWNAVGMESEIVRKGDVESLFPTAVRDVEQAEDGLALAFEALAEQGALPTFGEKVGVAEEQALAVSVYARVVHALCGADEGGEVVGVLGVAQLTLGDFLAAGVVHFLVSTADDMENDTVVGGVEVVAVGKPVGRREVYLHVAAPLTRADAQTGIQEIGTGIAVVDANRQDFNGLPVRCLLRKARPEALLPNIMEEYFRHFCCS